MPTQRTEVAAAAIGSKIYAVGGFSSDGRVDDVDVYNAHTDSWDRARSIPTPIHHAAVVSHDGLLYVIGGYVQGWIPSAQLFIYSPETDSWREGAQIPTPRGALTAQVIDGKIYAVGGFNSRILGTNEVYDPDVDSWERRADMPTRREHLSSATVGGKLYVIAGRTGGLDSNLNVNEAYDPVTDTWTSKAPMPSRRGGLVASSISESIFVFGGEATFGTFENNEQYIPSLDSWDVRQPLPTSRHGLAAATIANTIYVIGGGPTPGGSFSGANEAFTPSELQAIKVEEPRPPDFPEPSPRDELEDVDVRRSPLIQLLSFGIPILLVAAILIFFSLKARRSKG